ncbi:hypothetical protein FHX03_000275 [Rhizobium sp. BK456]|nr:hypothetical protein [Rhizobium sp. BK456]
MNPLAPRVADAHHSHTRGILSSVSFQLGPVLRTVPRAGVFF